jgi:phosphoglycerate dehydrogenase-like enzyme
MKIAVLDDYQGAARSHADWTALERDHQLTIFDRNIPLDEAASTLQPFDVICHMRERMAFPREVIEALPNLQLLCITGPVHRTMDMAAATERGIPVCHTEGRPGITMATPELTWGLMLSVARNIPAEAARMPGGGWQTTVGMQLHGKTLGLLGLGRIGRQVAVYGKAFGMRVIAWSANLTPEKAQEGGAEWVSKEDLFRQADVVSVHLVLSPRSEGLVGAAEIALMKPGAILLNTSRGPIIDKPALLAGLQSGAIRAGIDVYEEEPLPDSDPLRRVPNAVLTPHLGYVTSETYQAFYGDTVANIEAFVAGAPTRVVNPDALGGA